VNLKSVIREIPDFPKPGILFYDITTLMNDPDAFRIAVNRLVRHYKSAGVQKIAAIDARGFIFGAPMALAYKVGLVPVRKAGKLPADVFEATYSLEYGSSTLAIHRDAIQPGERTVIVDDLLATGGTAAATGDLVRKLGGKIVGYAFVVELTDLKGRDKLGDSPVLSLIQY
jgi:adenine phosphoribosyltransferase